jgi:hypothetical protein
MKTRLLGSEFSVRTDGQDEVYVRFSQFCERAQKRRRNCKRDDRNTDNKGKKQGELDVRKKGRSISCNDAVSC